MIVRWIAAKIAEAQRRFRRIRGHHTLKTFLSAIGCHRVAKTPDLEKRVA